MFVIIGADWCMGCKALRKKLMEKSIDHRYVQIPPGPTGWDMVESLTGRRAVPAVLHKFDNLNKVNELLNDIDLPTKELTEDELDELD